MKKTVVVVGGGWAGCAAALAAKKSGCQVTLLERTDMLLGTGLVGGIMRNNGRFTATEEALALGFGDLFALTDKYSRHRNLDFPGHKHASLYDVSIMEAIVKGYLLEKGIDIFLQSRITDLEMDKARIEKVSTPDGREFSADVFIDCTGTAGPMGNCAKYGNGCAMCILRCLSFGGRVSLAGKAGVKEIIGQQEDGSLGAMSGSCKLMKESLAPWIQEELNTKGLCIIPIPKAKQDEGKLVKKACQQYALSDYAENIILLDTGHAKLMAPFFPLEVLREIAGLEKARYEDPYSGGIGNSIRYLGMAPRNDALVVEGLDNLLCAGEKAGPLVGHTEAIVTGSLAGYNATKLAFGIEPLILPKELAIGLAIEFVRKEMETPRGLSKKYTFSGSVLFEHLKKLGLYSTNPQEIRARVQDLGLLGLI